MYSPESVFPVPSGFESSATTALFDGNVSMPPDSKNWCVLSREELLTDDAVTMTGCREVITG